MDQVILGVLAVVIQLYAEDLCCPWTALVGSSSGDGESKPLALFNETIGYLFGLLTQAQNRNSS
jgi:hypothetical protein